MSLSLALVASSLQAQEKRSARFSDWTQPVFPRSEYAARHAAVPAIDGRSRRTILFIPATDARFTNAARPNDFPGRELLSDPSLRERSGVDSVTIDEAFEQFLAGASAQSARVLINFDRPGAMPSLPPAPFTPPSPGDLLVSHVHRRHAALVIESAYPLMARLRMVKSAREIAALRESARITSLAIAQGAFRAKAGVDERTLAGAFASDCMAHGAQRTAFSPIVKSGANSLWPWRILGAHCDRRNRQLRSGELVIFDVGCERDHYVNDGGRTFPVNGRFTPRQRELVEMVRHISDAVIAAARPGVTLTELQRIAEGATPTAARPYMQAPPYFGHHLGLSAGDPSLGDAVLAAGMVFTIEPWYFIHDESVAVFLEDEILISPTGSENLTAALPRDATGLEALRNGLRRPSPRSPSREFRNRRLGPILTL